MLARDMPVHTVYNVMYEFMYMYRPYSNDINVTVTIGPTFVTGHRRHTPAAKLVQRHVSIHDIALLS